MIESGYYPAGAEHDSQAPWNQEDNSLKSFNVTISQSLSKCMSVETDDYIEDGAGNIDTSDTNWREAYYSSHYSPLELIQKFKDTLYKINDSDILSKKEIKLLIRECEGWLEDETEIIED